MDKNKFFPFFTIRESLIIKKLLLKYLFFFNFKELKKLSYEKINIL